MDIDKAFQDCMPNNHCFGCGPENELGLQIKSYWVNEYESECTFKPSPHHSAGPLHYLNGGIISTIIDCHCICTAIAKGYHMADREIGEGDIIWFVTGNLQVSYLKPVAIDREVHLLAKILEAKESKITLECHLTSNGEICAEGKVVAVRVPVSWLE